MFKKIVTVLVMVIFISASGLLAATKQDYEEKLSIEQKNVEELSAQIKDLNKQLSRLAKEYGDADIALRMDIKKKQDAMIKEVGEEAAKRATIQESKERSAQLRKDYHEKKAPLAKQINSLKTALAVSKRNIKIYERKLDKIKEGFIEDESYEETINDLKLKLQQNRDSYHQSLADLENDTNQKLAALEGKDMKEQQRKAILSQAKAQEVALFKDYGSKKAAIKKQIEDITKDYRKRLNENRRLAAQKKAEEAQQQKLAAAPTGESVTTAEQPTTVTRNQNFSIRNKK
jgi:chromosome segregation ATPase